VTLQRTWVLGVDWTDRSYRNGAALAGRKQGDRLLMKGAASVLLGFRLNPSDGSILFMWFHSSQETGARQEVQTVSPGAVVSLSKVGPVFHFILFGPDEYASDCLSRSHKTKVSSLSSLFAVGEVDEIHTFPEQTVSH
jgi:hypothetical protein